MDNFIKTAKACLGAQVDHGFGAGDSGLRVYLAGAADVTPRQIFAAVVPWCETDRNRVSWKEEEHNYNITII